MKKTMCKYLHNVTACLFSNEASESSIISSTQREDDDHFYSFCDTPKISDGYIYNTNTVLHEQLQWSIPI